MSTVNTQKTVEKSNAGKKYHKKGMEYEGTKIYIKNTKLRICNTILKSIVAYEFGVEQDGYKKYGSDECDYLE